MPCSAPKAGHETAGKTAACEFVMFTLWDSIEAVKALLARNRRPPSFIPRTIDS